MGLELELELLSGQLPPIRTTAPAMRPDGDDNAVVVVDGFATPTSAASVLRAPLVCPPAPRKPRPTKRKTMLHHRRRRRGCGSAAPQRAPVRLFIAVPRDLSAVFVARPGSACRPPAGKKIRVHVVG